MKRYQTIALTGVMALLSVGSLAFAQTSSTTDMDGMTDASSTTATTSSTTDNGANTNTNGSSTTSQVMPVTPTASTPTATAYPAPMVVQIGNAGDALIRGTVQTVGANSITILSWGGTWTIRTNAAGTMSSVFAASNTGQGDMSAINAGDFVGAEGVVANNETSTINATLVRDWTTNPFQGSSMSETSALNTTTGATSSSAGVNTGATGTSATGGGTTY